MGAGVLASPNESEALSAPPVSETEVQLCKKIKALIAKGDKAQDKAEQFYLAAGIELKRLKAGCFSQDMFLTVIDRIGVGKTRAYELLAIAEGKKTVAGVRAAATERKQLADRFHDSSHIKRPS
jgi:hypothetical protein